MRTQETDGKKLRYIIASNVKRLRLTMGLSQEELANFANVPISQIGRIERGEGNPTLSTLFSLSKALNVDLKDLIGFNHSI